MGASTAMTIATMNAMNNANNHHHQHSPDENTQLLAAIGLALMVLPVLWIVFTSIRQLVRRDIRYDFFDENDFALITLAVFGGFALFIVLVIFIYTLIK
jgi:uncharacterized BrkB/YihY/UPF0761 family membrane protein